MESFVTKWLTFIANIFGIVIDGINGAVLRVMGLNGSHTFDLFFGIFSASRNYMDLFKAFGLALILVIYVFQLFKTFFGPLTSGTEHPVYLSMKAVMFTFLVTASDLITGILIDVGTVPYKMVLDIDNSAQNLDVTIGEKIMDPEAGLGKHIASLFTQVVGVGIFGGAIVVFLLATMAGIIAYSYVKLALEIVERYVILAILVMFAPLCIATGVSRNTNSIFQSWFKMFISQLVLMSMSVFFIRMFTNGLTQIFANMGVTSFTHTTSTDPVLQEALRGIPGLFIGMLILFAWLRTGQRIDAHMSSLGMTAAQSGGGLGADLFMGIGRTSGLAVGLANKVGGTNYRKGGDVIMGEAAGLGQRVKGGAGMMGALATGKTPKASQDTISNFLKGEGNMDHSLTRAQKAAARATLQNGGVLNGDTIKDAMKNGDIIGSHGAVGAGIGDMMSGAIPEGFQATDGSINGQKGVMSGTFMNEDGESFDAVFSKEPLGEGSIPVTDSEGNTWFATAQGDGAAEFYSGNSNSVDEAQGADLADFAGGESEMVQAADGEEPQGHAIDADANGDLVEMSDGTLEEMDGDAVFGAEDIDGNMHDMSGMVNEDGEFVGEGTMGTIDEDGNFVPSEDGSGTHMQTEDGSVFEMAGQGEEGQVFASAGQMISGEGDGAQFMAEDTNGQLHDMSGQVDSEGNFIGEGTMGTMDADGNFVPSEDGSGTHMQTEDGSVFTMDANGEGFAESGMYTQSGEPTTMATDMAGNTQDISGHIDENGVMQGERFSQNENGEMVPNADGDYVQTSDGSMFAVDSEGRAMGATQDNSSAYSKIGDSATGLTGAKFSQNENGEMVPDSKGNFVQTSSGGFAPVNENGTVNSYSASEASEGAYVGFTNSNGTTSYAKAETNSDGSIRTNTDGSVNLANGMQVSAGDYAKAAVNTGVGAGLVDSSGEKFALGNDSFNPNGEVKTFAPVMENGQFAYDKEGNQLFEPSTGGGFVQDSSGNFREIGAASVNTPGLTEGSVMRNSSGEQFTLGSNSVGADGVRTFEPVRDADGNIATEGGKEQYRPSSNGNYVMDSQGNMQEVAKSGTGAFKFENKPTVGDYVKTSSGGTFEGADGSQYAQLAPSTSMQTFEKTDQGFRPSANGSYVQSVDESGNAKFEPIADSGKAGNGVPLRYSQTEDGGYVRDNNGAFVQTQSDSGSPTFSRVSDNAIKPTSDVQRYSYDSDTQSYIPDAKGDSVQTYDSNGDISYAKLDRSSVSDKGVATYDKQIKDGRYDMPVQPALGKTVEPSYSATGSNTGNYYRAGNTMYQLGDPGSLKSDGSVQRYSKNEHGRYIKDDNGKFIKGRAEGATTPTFTNVGTAPVERYEKGYTIGSARVNANGAVTIGPNDKMVNNKDGTIDLQFADGRTARLSNSNMYKNSGNIHDPAYAGKIRFGGGDYHYQDTTPAYRSFGSNVKPGDTIKGKGFEDIVNSLKGDDSFTRRTNYGTRDYVPMKDHKFTPSDIQQGKIATYVKTPEGKTRPATRDEVKNPNVEKFVQPKVGGGFVGGRGFDGKNRVIEAYRSESKIERSEIGKDGHLYIYNQPNKDGNQDVYCAISAKSGKKPKGDYETKVINNEQYYVVKGNINPSKGNTNMDVHTVDDKSANAKFELKKGIDVQKRSPVRYNPKVDKIIKN